MVNKEKRRLAVVANIEEGCRHRCQIWSKGVWHCKEEGRLALMARIWKKGRSAPVAKTWKKGWCERGYDERAVSQQNVIVPTVVRGTYMGVL